MRPANLAGRLFYGGFCWVVGENNKAGKLTVEDLNSAIRETLRESPFSFSPLRRSGLSITRTSRPRCCAAITALMSVGLRRETS